MSTAPPARLVILISGNGSNLQAFIDGCSKDSYTKDSYANDSYTKGSLNAQIAAVISNRPGALGLERAESAGIPTEIIDHRQFDSRDAFDRALMHCIDSYHPELVILAGFMRILTPAFVQHFSGRLLNIHPSLLPKYTGLNTHQRAIEAGDSSAGATVHFVTEQLDGGPLILQVTVPIEAGDNAETLAERVLQQEHKIYPLVAQWFIEGRLKLQNNRAILDDKQLPETGIKFSDLIH